VSPTFLLATLAVVATPGTGVLYTLAAGLSHGRRAGLVAALGCTLGNPCPGTGNHPAAPAWSSVTPPTRPVSSRKGAQPSAGHCAT
jgi:hypothetical protein